MDVQENGSCQNSEIIRHNEDNESRFSNIQVALAESRKRTRQLSSLLLNKDTDDKMKIKTALHCSNENCNENVTDLNTSKEKIFCLENDVEKLREENKKLLEFLKDEQERGKLLESELELFQNNEFSLYLSMAAVEDDWTRKDGVENTNEKALHSLAVKFKKELEIKEAECNELEDKLSMMKQELRCENDKHTRTTTDLEQQLSTVHEILSKERQLNRSLSEESDERQKELNAQLRKKDEMNELMRQACEKSFRRMNSLEEQSCLYKTKLDEVEESLADVYRKKLERKKSVLCQIGKPQLCYVSDETVYKMFKEVERKDFLPQLGSSARYKLNIVKLLQHGFIHFSGDLLKMN